jgi:hypothetical protein
MPMVEVVNCCRLQAMGAATAEPMLESCIGSSGDCGAWRTTTVEALRPLLPADKLAPGEFT